LLARVHDHSRHSHSLTHTGTMSSSKKKRMEENEKGEEQKEGEASTSSTGLVAASPCKKRRIRRGKSSGQQTPSLALEASLGAADADITSWPPEPGMILKINMKNFMSHHRFVYRPNQRLNFLSGPNGSGKSAVLTAVVFALGGSAKSTNRGTANHQLVRHGQNEATVEVTLYNGGDDAYKPEVYGDQLTVCRTIRGGATTYRFLAANGKAVQHRRQREELDRILDAFRIQVDNPVAVLNQDEAKTFLMKGEPLKFYEFFLRATLLDVCRREYGEAMAEKDAAKERI